MTLQGNLDALVPDFVAGNLLWYPVEGRPYISVAPDVMVALGRPKGDRRSYLQWQEDNIAPQVVFEIASPSNTRTELEDTKLTFYQDYGVEEYYSKVKSAVPPLPTEARPRQGFRIGDRYNSFHSAIYLRPRSRSVKRMAATRGTITGDRVDVRLG